MSYLQKNMNFAHPICAILEQSISNKLLSKTEVGMSTTNIYLYLCKFYSHLNGDKWRSSITKNKQTKKQTNKPQNKKETKNSFIAALILLFIGKIFNNLIASLSRLKAVFLNATFSELNNSCSFYIEQRMRNLVASSVGK